MRCTKRREAHGRPHGRAARHSRSPGKPRPSGFRRNGLICVVARLANRGELFAAPRRLASEAIAPETRLMRDLFRGSLAGIAASIAFLPESPRTGPRASSSARLAARLARGDLLACRYPAAGPA